MKGKAVIVRCCKMRPSPLAPPPPSPYPLMAFGTGSQTKTLMGPELIAVWMEQAAVLVGRISSS